jgi:hypothetical protein
VQKLCESCVRNITLLLYMGFDSYITPSQQLHNNLSDEGGPQCVWGPPSSEGLLCSCCIGVGNLTFSFIYNGKIRSKPNTKPTSIRNEAHVTYGFLSTTLT